MGKIIERLGVGRLLVVSTALVTAGLFGYALSPVIEVFLVFSVGIGFGSGAIDAALNVFAAEHFSDAVMNRLHGFFGITAGNMDSMVNRYTSDRRIRSDDAYTPDGAGGSRPDRSVIVYAQRAREAYPEPATLRV